MNLTEEIAKFEKEIVYYSRRTAEIAAQHQTSKEVLKSLKVKIKELYAKQKEQLKESEKVVKDKA